MPLAAKPPTGTFGADGWRAAALVILPLLAYVRLAHAGLVWDDDTTLTANPLVHAADGLRRLWFTRQPSDYWPVTFSSSWAESMPSRIPLSPPSHVAAHHLLEPAIVGSF